MAKTNDQIFEMVSRIYERLAQVGELIPTRLQDLTQAIIKVENQMANIDDLKREVEENTEVTASVVALVKGLRDEVAALKAQAQQTPGTDPELLATINDLAAKLDRNTADLANAVAANTPASSEPPVVQEPPVIPADPAAEPTVPPADPGTVTPPDSNASDPIDQPVQ